MEHRSKNTARSTFGNAMIALGGLLIAAALGLAAYNILDAKRAENPLVVVNGISKYVSFCDMSFTRHGSSLLNNN